MNHSVEEMAKALSASGMVMNVIKTDTLIMEYVALPVIDLSYRFLYRFLQPVPTVWVEGKLSLAVLHFDKIDLRLGNFALDKWKDLVLGEDRGRQLPPEAQWLLNMAEIKICECEIVRK